MSEIENPAAFPCVGYGPSGESYMQPGMSLRDYFAGQALAGEMASTSTQASCAAIARAAVREGRTIEQHIAFNSYRLADAMLAARAAGGEGAE